MESCEFPFWFCIFNKLSTAGNKICRRIHPTNAYFSSQYEASTCCACNFSKMEKLISNFFIFTSLMNWMHVLPRVVLYFASLEVHVTFQLIIRNQAQGDSKTAAPKNLIF